MKAHLVFIEKNMNNRLLVKVNSFPGDKYSSLEPVYHTLSESMTATGALITLITYSGKSFNNIRHHVYTKVLCVYVYDSVVEQ